MSKQITCGSVYFLPLFTAKGDEVGKLQFRVIQIERIAKENRAAQTEVQCIDLETYLEDPEGYTIRIEGPAEFGKDEICGREITPLYLLAHAEEITGAREKEGAHSLIDDWIRLKQTL